MQQNCWQKICMPERHLKLRPAYWFQRFIWKTEGRTDSNVSYEKQKAGHGRHYRVFESSIDSNFALARKQEATVANTTCSPASSPCSPSKSPSHVFGRVLYCTFKLSSQISRPIIGLSGCTSTCASARACRQLAQRTFCILPMAAFVAVAGLRGGMGMDVNKGVHGSCVDF